MEQTMQCSACGAGNPPQNRFCGMCGAALLPGRAGDEKQDKLVEERKLEANGYFSDRYGSRHAIQQEFAPAVFAPSQAQPEQQVVEAPASKAPLPITPPAVTPVDRPAAPAQRVDPVISPVRTDPPTPREPPAQRDSRPAPVVMGGGSSLLGLAGEMAPIHMSAPPEESDSSYLLEEPHRTISWRAWALVAILAGLGYLGWSQWSAMHHRTRPELAKVLEQAGNPVPPDTPVDNNATPPPASDTKDAASTNKVEQSAVPDPEQPKSAQPAAAQSAAPSAAQKEIAASPDASSPDSSTKAAGTVAPAPAPPKQAAPAPAVEPAKVRPARAAPPKANTVNYAQDPMLKRAQLYIHGHPQNCGMGLNYLKASAESNPKARIQMAALYESGVCVSRDRAQAYNWFSKAQEMEPHNMWLEKSRSQLWAEMTPSERARAH